MTSREALSWGYFRPNPEFAIPAIRYTSAHDPKVVEWIEKFHCPCYTQGDILKVPQDAGNLLVREGQWLALIGETFIVLDDGIVRSFLQTQENDNAAQEGQQPKDDLVQHQDGDGGRQATEAGGRHSDEYRGQAEASGEEEGR